ncbi:MAG TPA: hypothetical protein VM617_00375 [Thermoanaerobaculia bacterium]|nr:hypothetical protein [Thermoanaerobaculia bacterium]
MARGARQVGIVLLGIWLVLTGILTLTGTTFPLDTTIMGALALIAGILLLVGR